MRARNPLALLALAGMATVIPSAVTPASALAADAPCPIATDKADAGLSAIHDCAGLNVCKGLGGCKITAADLKDLATKRKVPADQMGQEHGCAGLNACKGLGGCKVTAEKFVKLFEKRRAAELAK